MGRWGLRWVGCDEVSGVDWESAEITGITGENGVLNSAR